ncbi:MAG: dual specificity protein phosphatase family protein [SAR324 cluster bacterium]|nr:dual specificity protein phosphatase family protein [SAR324 cluster bacterium]
MTSTKIDFVSLPNSTGKLFITCFPGLNVEKDFDLDILQSTFSDLVGLGCTTIVSLVEDKEFEEICGKEIFLEHIRKHDFQWHHLPIVDYKVPGTEFFRNWGRVCRTLKQEFQRGNSIGLHCKGGIGRSGTVAAMLLIEYGKENSVAIQQVRQKRKGAIENQLQEDFVRNFSIEQGLFEQL